jgi:hypothetical protein
MVNIVNKHFVARLESIIYPQIHDAPGNRKYAEYISSVKIIPYGTLYKNVAQIRI